MFCIGWCIVMLSLFISIGTPWQTFIHMWRVDLAASVFLGSYLVYMMVSQGRRPFQLSFSRTEIRFLVLPLCAFILWSAVSAIWAPSWKSAVHHTAVWTEYLLFYLFTRQILDTADGYSRLMKTVTVALFVLSVPAITEYSSLLIFGGANSLGITHAKYGEPINAILPLLCVGVIRLHGRRFWLGASAIVSMWLLVFCSLGRANLILFAFAFASVCFFVFVIRRFHQYRRNAAILATAIIVAPFLLQTFSLVSSDPEIPLVKRLSDGAGISSSNNFRRLMTSVALDMISAHPLIGIGADNFGFEFNKYRAVYTARNPSDISLAEAEDGIPERAHNEPLQVVAELGAIGGAIFLWLMVGVGLLGFHLFKQRNIVSLYPLAAFLGIIVFLASSLVSSYSFRLIQNGFVFFFVLALAAKLLLTEKRPLRERSGVSLSAARFRIALVPGLAACLLLAGYSTVRVVSVMFTEQASHTQDLDVASHLFQRAMTLDDENPDAPGIFGLRLLQEGKYNQAAGFLEKSIRIGRARSCDFSYLATAQTLSGDNVAAEKTMAEAALLYPRSPFVLTRHAALLSESGRQAESEAEFERALLLNRRAANTWWTMINDGARTASELAFRRNDFAEVMDLQPRAAMYAIVDERAIRFPKEKQESPFEKFSKTEQ